jgi:16S rRNA (guanine1207-N2)-methyltransferase
VATPADDRDPKRRADEAAPAHYFDERPDVASSRQTVEVSLPDVSLRLTSDRGVFSSDHLDAGTKLLLLEAPPLTADETTVLDLGCGWGPIAVVCARRSPSAQVWAVDVNERARQLTTHNATEAGVADQMTVCGPDDVPAEIRFDRILSNPPIRIGKTALHALLARWLDRLTPAGRAHLVVQRHLGSDSLARWLEQRGHPVERLKSRAGYRILEVGARPDPDDEEHT